MKIVFTGGHITPCLALIEKLLPEHIVLVIGRKHAFEGDKTPSFESRVLKEMHIPFKNITAGRLQRNVSLYTIPSLLKVPIGFFQALSILARYKPDVVLSFGGYISLPVCFAAFVLGIPIVTHEQTLRVGLANKIISRLARKICITFADSARFFPSKKTVLTGNPIRHELYYPPESPPFPSLQHLKQLPKLIYITGGSGGSHSINLLIKDILPQLLREYLVVHQSGNTTSYNDFAMLRTIDQELPEDLRMRYILKESFNVKELSYLYHAASLLIGRSGANTVYEILAFGVPSLLIPLPWAGASEQLMNAQLVAKAGLGKVILQKDLTAPLLMATINEMVAHIKEFKAQRSQGTQHILFDADQKIIDVLKEITGYAEKQKI